MELALGVIFGILATIPTLLLAMSGRQDRTVHHVHTVKHELVERQTWRIVETGIVKRGDN